MKKTLREVLGLIKEAASQVDKDCNCSCCDKRKPSEETREELDESFIDYLLRIEELEEDEDLIESISNTAIGMGKLIEMMEEGENASILDDSNISRKVLLSTLIKLEQVGAVKILNKS